MPQPGSAGAPGWKMTKYITAMMQAMENVVATKVIMPRRALCPVLFMSLQWFGG